MKKLLLIGSNAGNAHLSNFLELVRSDFDDVLVVSDYPVNFAPHRHISFSLRNPFKIVNSIRQLREIIEAYDPSIIHVHQVNSYAFISTRANAGKKPLVLTAWGSDVLILPKKSWIHKWLVKQGLKNADIITADSYQMKDSIIQLWPSATVINANFGVSLDLNLTYDAQRSFTIYSNRMHEPLYQIEELLDGMKTLLKKDGGSLVLAGKGSLTEHLKAKVERNNLAEYVTFVGFVTRTQNIEYYLRSKYFISIPKSDGTSISLLEAMAYGCIPIVSDLPANREWIEDGVNGIIKSNEEAMEQAIYRGNQLDPQLVQERNKEIIALRATKEANAKLFLAIYNRFLRSEAKEN